MKRFFIALAIICALVGGASVAAYREPVRELISSTVKISYNAKGHGSGFYIGDGLILTAAHVVDGAPGKVTVKFMDGSESPGVVLWQAGSRDVAMIKIDPVDYVKAAPLKCAAPVKGELIYAEGNPLNMEFVTVWGTVAGNVREFGPWHSVFVTNIATVPGQSGGPVFNLAGEVVGITVGVMIYPTGFSASLVGIGYAVPGDVICNLLAR